MFQAYEHREKLLECLAQLEQQALQGTVLVQWPFQCCVLVGREREGEREGEKERERERERERGREKEKERESCLL